MESSGSNERCAQRIKTKMFMKSLLVPKYDTTLSGFQLGKIKKATERKQVMKKKTSILWRRQEM